MSVEPARRIMRMVPGPESLSSRHAERVGRGSAQRNVPYFCPRVPVSAQQIPDAEVGRRHRQAPNLMVLRREESTVWSPYTFEVLAICAAEQSPGVPTRLRNHDECVPLRDRPSPGERHAFHACLASGEDGESETFTLSAVGSRCPPYPPVEAWLVALALLLLYS